MEKSIFTKDYALCLRLLRAARKRAGLTQEDLASVLGQTQFFISKCERGERRLDIVEVRAFCQAIGVSFPKFVDDFDKALHRE